MQQQRPRLRTLLLSSMLPRLIALVLFASLVLFAISFHYVVTQAEQLQQAEPQTVDQADASQQTANLKDSQPVYDVLEDAEPVYAELEDAEPEAPGTEYDDFEDLEPIDADSGSVETETAEPAAAEPDESTSGEAGFHAPHLGMGLYVARQIALRHDAELIARNLDYMVGVEVCLRLPVLPAKRGK